MAVKYRFLSSEVEAAKAFLRKESRALAIARSWTVTQWTASLDDGHAVGLWYLP